MTLTIDPSLERKDKIKILFEYHKSTFKKLNVDNPYFVPKVAYLDGKLKEKVVSFFPSEMKKGTDIYVEFTTRDLQIEDKERILYKWTYNPWYADEYQMSEPHNATADRRYLIPISELIAFKKATSDDTVEETNPFSPKRYVSTKVKEELDFELPNADLDLPFDQLTIRDLAAILLKKPVSMKPWLNEIIKTK
jgi:hypothetical protein